MATIQQYRSTVADYLREGYGATGLRLRGGGKHTRYEFHLPGREGACSILLNDRNGGAGSNAPDLKLQDIRRDYGPPSWPRQNGHAAKRTLEEMTEDIEEAAARSLSRVKVPDHVAVDQARQHMVQRLMPSWECVVALYRGAHNRALSIGLPQEAIDAFYSGYDGPRGTDVGFTAPDLWTIRHSAGEARAPDKSRRITLGGAAYLGMWDPFGQAPATATLIGGRLEVRLRDAPAPAGSTARAAQDAPQPETREEVVPVGNSYTVTPWSSRNQLASTPPVAPEPPGAVPGAAPLAVYGPSHVLADQLDALRAIRRVEAETPYRLTKVRAEDGSHAWEWRAPPVRLEDR